MPENKLQHNILTKDISQKNIEIEYGTIFNEADKILYENASF